MRDFNLIEMFPVTPKLAVELDQKSKSADLSSDWDYLEDGYFSKDERAELGDMVRNEKLDMMGSVDLDPASLGLAPKYLCHDCNLC